MKAVFFIILYKSFTDHLSSPHKRFAVKKCTHLSKLL